jgi:ParB/RepB/Spo0J family partition protein
VKLENLPNKNDTMKKGIKPLDAPTLRNVPTEEQIPASQLERYPENRIPRPEAVEEMRQSIEELGLLSPIMARPVPGEAGGMRLQIIAGETRWLGCRAIHENYPVRCFVVPMDDKTAAKVHAVENFQREELDELDQARAVANMRATGWSIEEIGESLGLKKSALYDLLTLLKLDPAVHEALRDGNLTKHTAVLLAGLPEDKRAAALAAVVEPDHAARALPEREAMELIRRKFVVPMERSAAWEERRRTLESAHPGAVWQDYEEVLLMQDWASGYEVATEKPGFFQLSDAARCGEQLVPTWGELAERHGAPVYIGFLPNDPEAVLFVQTKGLVDAEIAAHDDAPGECVFSHPKAARQAKLDTERANLARQAEREAADARREAEAAKLATWLMEEKLPAKRLVDLLFTELGDLLEDFSGEEVAARLLGVAEDEPLDQAAKKWLRRRTMDPWESFGRLIIAARMEERALRYYAHQTLERHFVTGVLTAADYPALAELNAPDLSTDEEGEP